LPHNGTSNANDGVLVPYQRFGEKPVLKLMFGALIRAAERWRGLRFTEFELRQIAAVRKDLDAALSMRSFSPDARYEAQ
jgi:hypothetical protein